jgi:hypothetical protein
MKFIRRALAACLLCATAWAGAAAAPLPKVDATAGISPVFDLDAYAFRIADGDSGYYQATLELFETPLKEALPAGMMPPGVSAIAFGIVKQSHGWGWRLIDFAAGPGSFSFYAGAGLYQALVGGINFSGHEQPYQLRVGAVSAVPEPEPRALLLVGLGFIVYQLRRQRPPASWGVKPRMRPRA